MNIGFATAAYTRDLPKAEMERRGLPLRWWAEFQCDLVCVSAIAGEFTVPTGFLTDGASVPRPVWAILSGTDPDILYPAYAHDLLYTLNGCLPARRLTRQECDAVIREQMLAVNAPAWKANLVYLALRIGGLPAWKSAERHRKAITATP